MITEPARLAEISVDLGEISSRRDENFSYKHSSRLTGIDRMISEQKKTNSHVKIT